MKRLASTTHHFYKENAVIILFSLIVLLLAIFLREPLYGIFGEQNYLGIHLVFEFFIVTIAFTIAIQSWRSFPFVLSSTRLWLGALFFSVGLIEIAHALTYKGMPFFFSESSTYKATWFFMIARLTEVIGLLIIISKKDRTIPVSYRWLAYMISFIYALCWIIGIWLPTPFLPGLVQEGVGTTTIKNFLQYGGIVAELLIIYVVLTKFRSKAIFNNMLITGSIYLIIADYFFTTYVNVLDIKNFTGHLFQLAGFYFIQRAVYHTAVEEPFQKQQESEEKLKKHERFLETITSHMGEGLIVMDSKGDLTYLNFEAERMLLWSESDLLGKNVHDYIHRKEDGGKFPYEECPSKICSTEGIVYRSKEDFFVRRDGSIFPVAYVVTPYFEDGKPTGTILVFRDITQMKKDQERIHFMAFHDELTKLPNIRYLKEELNALVHQQSDSKAAIFVLDIDRFKNINEALGYHFGDLILKAVAVRLRDLPANILLCRLTGDEFALILKDEKVIEEVVTEIQQLLNEPLQAQQLFLNVTMTSGIAIYPDHGDNAEDLLQHANLALKEAQRIKKSFQIYEPSLNGKAYDRLVFENDLYHALPNNEFRVVYQPQVDTKTGQILGFEALIRWNHPVHGWVSPATFIPIAEDTGLIIPIGEWVLRTACQQLKEWHERGFSQLVVAVNLSIRQFYQQNLVEKVQQILEEANLEPQYLEIEITESMMMDVDHTMKILNALKDLGVHISIDDFGTGYSSLSYLKHLPVDRLKIDQSFVRDLLNKEDTTIVSTIISMARHLNLEVIAEGVETVQQRNILQSQHCQQAQGYLYSPPLTTEEISDRFEELQRKFKELEVNSSSL